MIKLFLIIFIFFVACTGRRQNEYTSILQTTDSLSIAFKFEDRVSAVHKTDKWVFDAINKVLSGKDENCSCQTTGFIQVYNKDSVELDIDFATETGGSEKGCQFLILHKGTEKKCYRLNYRLGMYFDELRNFIKP